MLGTPNHFNQFKIQTTPSVQLYKQTTLFTLMYILFPYMQFLCFHFPLQNNVNFLCYLLYQVSIILLLYLNEVNLNY